MRLSSVLFVAGILLLNRLVSYRPPLLKLTRSSIQLRWVAKAALITSLRTRKGDGCIFRVPAERPVA